ncbi:hypothetical protein [Nannocystis pusilla]|uniref:hypothetical protein n=1 Tax=Nannocystis pusilla TaxID=889268 RepID=UPI003B80DA6E
MPTSTYLVVQSGAEVSTITTRAEAVALFGTVDAPVEAMFLTTLDGYVPLCDASKAREIEGGYELLAKKNFNECLNQFHGHVVTVKGETVSSQTEVDLTKPDEGCAVAGRRPEGFRPAPRTGGSALVAYLDEMHHLEAASVPAFERLARELAHHGASAALVERAEAAARDEVRHAAGFAGLRAPGRDRLRVTGDRGAGGGALARGAGARERGRGLRTRDVRRAGGPLPGVGGRGRAAAPAVRRRRRGRAGPRGAGVGRRDLAERSARRGRARACRRPRRPSWRA